MSSLFSNYHKLQVLSPFHIEVPFQLRRVRRSALFRIFSAYIRLPILYWTLFRVQMHLIVPIKMETCRACNARPKNTASHLFSGFLAPAGTQ